MSAVCRTCRAPVLWAVTEGGTRAPLDPEPRADGNVEVIGTAIVDGRETPLVRYLKKGEGDTLPGLDMPTRHVSHFATCPDADQHRRT